MKLALLEVADRSCGRTKDGPRNKKTWWWNDDASNDVSEKHKL